ncbi:MAG: hypothetical protein CMJ59_08360 [Planctomycetaceae bacterium]|nr:hypothetical protein [Planctomycetaceae bacterium]
MSVRYDHDSDSGPTRRRLSKDNRRGFTLLEMMLTLAIMATALGLAWPMLRRPLLRSVTQQAAHQLTRAMSDARALAIRLGRPLQLRYEREGRRYQLRPIPPHPNPTVDQPPHTTAESHDISPASSPAVAASTFSEWRDFELPNGVSFRAPSQQRDPTAASSPTELPLKPLVLSIDTGVDLNGSAHVHFFPDGRADQAVIPLYGPGPTVVEVTLRGLTGTASSGPLQRLERLPTEADPVAIPAAP